MSPPLFVVVLLALSVIPSTAVHALESDRDQPALIEADEVELDFGSGQRIYRGNVSIKQGTIRIIADELELFYQGEQLEKAIARGNPAVFRQRPDQKPQDVIGQSKIIELDEINNIVTFIDQATIRQGRDAISGETIVYDMARDKMKVRGQTRTTKAPEQPKVGSSQSPATLVTSASDRPRIVLQPRSKETNAATVASTGSPGAKDTSTATHSNSLQTAAFRAAYVVEGGALMYGVRSQASPSIGALNAGDPVKVIISSDGWSKVNVTRGVKVWIYGRY
ncbi:MAG: lipopolysaccharide transport periplasmic protein LptA, partial [Pseudomonadota bacterium]|nr:lipopolysaccharide transport periplasmic protein LptA [Pseudomonadota bacterium]